MTATGEATDGRWSRLELAAFRFAFAYALLFFPIQAVSRLPLFTWVDDLWNGAWACIVPWVARHVLGITRGFPDTTDGLGDFRYSYARVACVALFATVVAVVWTILDRSARDHRRLREWLEVLLRYGLANAMLVYGLGKVFEHQFSGPSLELLAQPYGDQSAQDVLWHFMGVSRPYTIFGGLAECAGGLLLLDRRTTTLGALVVAAVMTNVVMLDFSYDVPVKLYASHLLVMALFLASTDARRLANVLVLRRPTEPAPLPPHFAQPRWERVRRVVKVAFVLYLTTSNLRRLLIEAWASADSAPRPALYGIWEVSSSAKDVTWRRLVIDRPTGDPSHVGVTIWHVGGVRERLRGTEDDARRTLVLEAWKEDAPKVQLSYARVDDAHLVLTSTGDRRGADAAAPIELLRRDEGSFALTQRHFRWSVGDSGWRH
jgi:uncharacterized membrane protein YphA (DoxX/SURF4 family)